MRILTKVLALGLYVTSCLRPAEPGTAPAGLPKVVAPLTEGTWTWIGKMNTGNQTSDVVVTVGVKAVGDTWVIRHVVSSPGRDDAIDIGTLDRQTMECIGREAVQGPMTMKLDTKGGKVKGSITVSGRVQTIETDAGGPLFADGIAARQSIVALPLAEGYTTTYRTLDPQLKPRIVELKVAGTEKVTVAAGSFEALRVETRALDGAPEPMTLWMDKGSRKLVKMAAVIGPTTVSAELK